MADCAPPVVMRQPKVSLAVLVHYYKNMGRFTFVHHVTAILFDSVRAIAMQYCSISFGRFYFHTISTSRATAGSFFSVVNICDDNWCCELSLEITL